MMQQQRATVTWDFFRERTPVFASQGPTRDYTQDELVRVTLVAFGRRPIVWDRIYDCTPGEPFTCYVPEGYADDVLAKQVEPDARVALYEQCVAQEAQARAEHEAATKPRPDGSRAPYTGPSAERLFFELHQSKPGTQLKRFRSMEVHREDRRPPVYDKLATARRREHQEMGATIADGVRLGVAEAIDTFKEILAAKQNSGDSGGPTVAARRTKG